MNLADMQKRRLEAKMKKNCKNCTKKYKCVESDYFKKPSDTWKQNTMSRFERVE